MNKNKARYKHLGIRAYWLFFFRKSRYVFGAVAIIIVFIFAKRFFAIPDNMLVLVDQAIMFLLALFFIVFVGGLLISALQYIAYEFALDEHALKIRSGILNIEINAVPYRQMQNIDIERDIIYRLFGISRMVILTAGTENTDTDNESGIVIPALDKHLALRLQEELLHRANIEQVQHVSLEKPV